MRDGLICGTIKENNMSGNNMENKEVLKEQDSKNNNSFATEETVEIKEKQEKKKNKKEKKNKKKKSITLEELYPEWMEYYESSCSSLASVKRYSSEWDRFYEKAELIKIPLKDLKVVDMEMWLNNQIKTYSLTRKKYYTMSRIIRGSFEYAYKKEYIKKNTFDKVEVNSKLFQKEQKKADKTEVFTDQESEDIIKAAYEDFQEKPNDTTPLAVILAFCLGTRPGETVAICTDDIMERKIHIHRSEVGVFEKADADGVHYTRKCVRAEDHTKTSAGDREVYLTEDAHTVINLVKEVNRKNRYTGKFLFVLDGKRIKETGVKWRLEKYCKHLGIEVRTPHKIRKTVISKMLDGGMNLNTVRKMVGHEDEKTTLRNYYFDRREENEIYSQFQEIIGFKEFNVAWIPKSLTA